jgi:hypothetical protein
MPTGRPREGFVLPTSLGERAANHQAQKAPSDRLYSNVESILWIGLGKRFCPEGVNDSSDSTELAGVLAVYCLGMQKKSKRPVGIGMIRSEEAFCDFER